MRGEKMNVSLNTEEKNLETRCSVSNFFSSTLSDTMGPHIQILFK